MKPLVPVTSYREPRQVFSTSQQSHSAWDVRWGDITAAITLSLLPTLIFTFFVQCYLVADLTLEAIKE